MKIKGQTFSGEMDFERTGTGGGCKALSATMEDNFHIFISDEASLPTRTSKSVSLWIEDDNGTQLFCVVIKEGTAFHYESLEGNCKNGTLDLIYG